MALFKTTYVVYVFNPQKLKEKMTGIANIRENNKNKVKQNTKNTIRIIQTK